MPDRARLPRDLESLAAHFHALYQEEARRQGDVRHADEYETLSENVKEFDRALARPVLALLAALDEAEKALRMIEIGAISRWGTEIQRIAREARRRIGDAE